MNVGYDSITVFSFNQGSTTIFIVLIVYWSVWWRPFRILFVNCSISNLLKRRVLLYLIYTCLIYTWLDWYLLALEFRFPNPIYISAFLWIRFSVKAPFDIQDILLQTSRDFMHILITLPNKTERVENETMYTPPRRYAFLAMPFWGYSPSDWTLYLICVLAVLLQDQRN